MKPDFSRISLYPQTARLDACIERLLSLECVDDDACRRLREKLVANTFNILVVGQFNRGKTTLINAIMGAELLPVGILPLTSVVTVLSYGERPSITVFFQDGSSVEASPEQLSGYVTERENPHNEKGVREVSVYFPSPWLKDGVRIVDTPGIGSVFSHNTDVAYRYLPNADAVLFLLSADQPVSRAECDFLRDVREHAAKIFFLLNKSDYLKEDELRDAETFARATLAEALGSEPFIVAVSARLALEGKLAGSQELLKKSRLSHFFAVLEKFLVEEKGQVLVDSVAGNLRRLISRATLELEMERKSLHAPLAELEEKLRSFELKKREVETAREEYAVLLAAEAKKLLQRLENELEKFKEGLQGNVRVEAEETFRAHEGLPAGRLNALLESSVVEAVRTAFDNWRAAAGERLSEAFASLCARYAERIDETADELLRYSAGLFDISFTTVKAGTLVSAGQVFYYKFWSEPPGLKLITSSLILALPKFIGARLILRNTLRYAAECVEMQSGRLRHDFAVRFDSGLREFSREMTEKLEATAAGIDAAITKGMERRRRGDREVEALDRLIREKLGTLVALDGELAGISPEGPLRVPFMPAP